jgi:hypothetical protein
MVVKDSQGISVEQPTNLHQKRSDAHTGYLSGYSEPQSHTCYAGVRGSRVSIQSRKSLATCRGQEGAPLQAPAALHFHSVSLYFSCRIDHHNFWSFHNIAR